MRGELSLIQRRLGITTLFVTHDQIEALSMSDRIAVMDGGRIVQEGNPQEIYQRPVNEFVASFIGSTNLFMGELDPTPASAPDRIRIKLDFGDLEVPANPDLLPGRSIIAAIRPEDIVMRRHDAPASADLDHPNVFEGGVGIGLFTGTSVEYYLDIGSTLIQARAGSRAQLKRGDPVRIEIPPDACRTFSLDGEPKVRLGSRRLATLARLDEEDDGR